MIMEGYAPSYIRLYETGELQKRIDTAMRMMEDCTQCPHQCHVNRQEGELGVCRVAGRPMVSSFGPHFGEESPLVGERGSGTIFLASCGLSCLFCQNYDISQLRRGEDVSIEGLSNMMLSLWRQGCHNINLVTPTHQTAFILSALPHAIEQGLDVPLVYNCGGYEEVATLELLDGVFDIYMPDFKYWDEETASKLSGIKGYPDKARAALVEMHRQVGDLAMNSRGIAVKGLLVRHLVLPEGLAGTHEVMRFIADEISPNTYVNVMDQYNPCHNAGQNPPLDRRITHEEFEEAIGYALDAGLKRLDNLWMWKRE